MTEASESVEQQLKEWKERMRAERNLRLSQPSRRTSTNATLLDSTQESDSSSDHRKKERRLPDAALSNSGQPCGASTCRHRDAAASFEDYRQQIRELSAPLAAEKKLTRYRRTGIPDKDVSAPPQAVNPQDVTYHPARSVVGEYIRRPVAPAAPPAPRREAQTRAPSVVKGKRSSAVPNTVGPQAGTRASCPRSAFARKPAPTADASKQNSKSSRALLTHERRPATSVSEENRSTVEEKRTQDTSGWTRATLLRREVALRALTEDDPEQTRTTRARSAKRTSSLDTNRADVNGSQNVSNHSVSNSFPRRTWGDAERAPTTFDEGSTHQPVRALFSQSPLSTRRTRPLAREDEPPTAFRWQEPANHSRFQPSLQYGSHRRSSPDRVNRGFPLNVEWARGLSWRRSPTEKGGAGASQRRSVSPPTPSPEHTLNRHTKTYLFAENNDGNDTASMRQDRGGRLGPEGSSAVWSVAGPSFRRDDLFQGIERGVSWGTMLEGKKDVSPYPRSIQPRPRPVWFRE